MPKILSLYSLVPKDRIIILFDPSIDAIHCMLMKMSMCPLLANLCCQMFTWLTDWTSIANHVNLAVHLLRHTSRGLSDVVYSMNASKQRKNPNFVQIWSKKGLDASPPFDLVYEESHCQIHWPASKFINVTGKDRDSLPLRWFLAWTSFFCVADFRSWWFEY